MSNDNNKSLPNEFKFKLYKELGKEFLLQYEEQVVSSFSSARDYVELNFEPELHRVFNGQMNHAHISSNLIRVSKNNSLNCQIVQTKPKGSHFAQLTTDSFVIGCTMARSSNWSNANYAKNLGLLNNSLESLNEELFNYEPQNLHAEDSRIFITMIVYNDIQGLPSIYFGIPYSDLKGYHFKFSVDDVVTVGESYENESRVTTTKLKLKKRLNELEDITGTA